jgi:hypothetical protein
MLNMVANIGDDVTLAAEYVVETVVTVVDVVNEASKSNAKRLGNCAPRQGPGQLQSEVHACLPVCLPNIDAIVVVVATRATSVVAIDDGAIVANAHAMPKLMMLALPLLLLLDAFKAVAYASNDDVDAETKKFECCSPSC